MQRPPEYARLLDEGTTLRQQGRLEEAVRVLQTASQLVSDDPALWSELAHAMRWQGQYGPAEEAARKALGVQPEHAPALFNLGAILADTGRVNEGIASYRKALQFKPDFAEAWSNLGMALGMIGKPEEEVDAYRRALEVNPALAMVWSNLGSALAGLGRFDEAAEACRRAVSVDAEYAIGWSNLADVLRQAGNFEEAVTACSKALAIDGGLAVAWHNLGIVSLESGNNAEAEPAFRSALELAPQMAAAWGGLGRALLRRSALDESIAAQERAQELDPNQADGWRNLGHSYWTDKKPARAVQALKRAVALFPEHAGLRADLVFFLMQICEWAELDSHLAWLHARADLCVAGQEVSPFASIVWCDDEAKNLAIVRAASDKCEARYGVRREFAVRRTKSDQRLTIGYLSNDLRNHAVAHLMRGVFLHHDHRRFRVCGYSVSTGDGSRWRNDIEGSCDVFREVGTLDYQAAARQIAADGVDILIDLNGWTGGVRYEICAQRPAPLQMTYLGYPGATGARFIDYAIVDEIIVPSASACHYRERLIYMPHTYQANDNRQEIADEPVTRQGAGLPDGAPVLCSFNRPEKIEPVMFEAWMRIMKRVPDAVLWLLIGDSDARRNLVDAAQQQGVATERIVFAEALPKPGHLRRFQLADLVLDTRIYNGHTTTSDALWAGVPVVTLSGRQFASRVSESLLRSIGVSDLVTYTLADYEALAVKLAQDRMLLNSFRQRIAANRDNHPLFDTPRFTHNLERAYELAWELHCGGQPPSTFKVMES